MKVFFMIFSQSKGKIMATSMALEKDSITHQKEVVMEEYMDIFCSPIGLPLHCQVKYSIDLTLDCPCPMGLYINAILCKMKK